MSWFGIVANRHFVAGLISACLMITGCSESKKYEASICALIDVSGTYAEEKRDVVTIIKAGILSEMLPGDSLFIIAIDSNSFSQENLLHKLKLDYRISHANSQKLAVSRKLDEFASGSLRSDFTDITGAMMLCGDYLKSTDAGAQMMFVFSDMQEDLQNGLSREFGEFEFENMHIAAMNVIKLTDDSNNPQIFRKRLAMWEDSVVGAGASSWDVLVDPSKITEYIKKMR